MKPRNKRRGGVRGSCGKLRTMRRLGGETGAQCLGRGVIIPMPALLVALVTLAGANSAPLESQSTRSLRDAQRSLRSGDVGRALATFDSLVLSDGVSVSLEAPSAMESAVGRGLQTWNSALGERAFRQYAAGSAADVTVRLVRSLDERGQNVQGFVEASRSLSWSARSHSYKLKGTIYVRDNADGRMLRPDEVASVVAHEAGHLLGLADVERDDCLMGPMTLGKPQPGPTAAEVESVRSYRSLVRRSYPKG